MTAERDATGGAAPRVAALVLAAGASRRMGASNKLLAPVGGVPLVTHGVDAALAAGVAPLLVVTGHQHREVAAALAGRELRLVHNPDYRRGLSTSLRAGIGALGAEVDAVLVCLADMPAVGAGHLRRLFEAFDPMRGRAICVPVFGGRRGNPVLWARRFFAAMREIDGDVGARSLMVRHAAMVREVAMDDDAVLRDVDTPRALVEAGRALAPGNRASR